MGLDNQRMPRTKSVAIAQRMGDLFDDLRSDIKRKPSVKKRLCWKCRQMKYAYHDAKYAVRNHIKWCGTINKLRPWEGFDGLLSVMLMHLMDYVATEEKYGHSEKEYKAQKIATAKETIKILRRMRSPDAYTSRRRNQVEKRYPKYKSLITKHNDGSTCISGRFVAQGNGWAGKESGKDPREGYFEFVKGRLSLATSPDQTETDRLLVELAQYHKDIDNAYKQAEVDSEKDFDRLGQLLKENLYSWWD
jgi:hypothetical protein